jgi:hypothetical protein
MNAIETRDLGRRYRRTWAVRAVLALPVLAGLFAGVPWVAREFESGAFGFTWTQGTSPRHWLLGCGVVGRQAVL